MKVKLEDCYKEVYTLSDLERAKRVIAIEKDDEETPKGWAEYAVREALRGTDDYLVRVLEASAKTALNIRVWDAYGEGTQNMDVWVRAVAKTGHGFIEVGAYLSDIWQTGSVPYDGHEYIKYYRVANLVG